MLAEITTGFVGKRIAQSRCASAFPFAPVIISSAHKEVLEHMRQRKVKNLEEKLQAVSAWMVEDPAPERWERAFAAAGEPADAERDIFLEIGCGRGDFILQQALEHPDYNYIGIEGQPSVVLRAMEKAAQIDAALEKGSRPERLQNVAERAGSAKADTQDTQDTQNDAQHDTTWTIRRTSLRNILFSCTFVNRMDELFAPDSLSGIYLNFSDPWPKARHAKRRLTWRGRLQDYAKALRHRGFIAVKTDNDALFDFTLEEIEACGWVPVELTRDLHGPDGKQYDARRIMTEYERKFREAGKNINYVKVVVL